jgi:cell division protein ZapE
VSTPSTAQIRAALSEAATAAGHTLDAEQSAAADALAVASAGILRAQGGGIYPGGVYLWGSVGRGKTWLADALFAALPVEEKRRLHFHSFYRRLHLDLYRDGHPKPGAIDDAIDDLVGGTGLLFFDEFHLHDAGDATLALRVLRAIVDRGVPLIATSNYPPAGLLPDPIFHHLFEPGIRIIESRLTAIGLDGATDYRRLDREEEHRVGFARGSWRNDSPAKPSDAEQVVIGSGGHRVTARRADATGLWISFAELCERPTSAADYLEWSERWPRWTVDGVPRLTTCTPQARQRFLNLVDVLNDRGVEATFVSALSPEQVLEGGAAPTARGAGADREELGLGLDGLPIDVARTASRLALLRRTA